MDKPPRKLPDCELAVMMTVWRAGEPVTSAYVAAHLEEARSWNASTLLNFLSRLVQKGFLACERQGKNNLYTPLISEKDYLKRESRSLFRRLYGNSLRRMLTALYDGKPLSQEEIDELQDFIRSKAEEDGRTDGHRS